MAWNEHQRLAARFRVLCDVEWDDMQATADADVRVCARCQHAVHAAHDEASFERHAAAGRCVFTLTAGHDALIAKPEEPPMPPMPLAGAPLSVPPLEMPPLGAGDLEPARANVLLGHPDAKVARCERDLPEIWGVLLEHAEGKRESFSLGWREGARIEPGYGALVDWLERHGEVLREAQDWRVQRLLEVLGGLPPGFNHYSFMGRAPAFEAAGGLGWEPFSLTLIMQGYVRSWPPEVPAPEPAGPVPVGGPPVGGRPGSGGPPGGAAPPVFGRAVLTGSAGEGWRWTIHWRQFTQHDWQPWGELDVRSGAWTKTHSG